VKNSKTFDRSGLSSTRRKCFFPAIPPQSANSLPNDSPVPGQILTACQWGQRPI